ncbi:MAG TPA: hypothetical protein DEV93_14240 [Chloroflexi bacterium]|nr:hypothetical protein [Chloroflexota bacterium]
MTRWLRLQWQRFNVRRRWHQLVLGRTAQPAGILLGITAEFNSGQPYGFNGLRYQVDFLPTAMMVIGQDAVLVKRRALDLAPGMVRVVLETCE